MKRLASLLLISLSLITPAVADAPFFGGYAGVLSDISLIPDSRAQAFFAGQMDFAGRFLVRTEFYVKTDSDDVELLSPAEDKNAVFNIQEISATYKVSLLNSTHYFSAYLGEFEPIGSDIFLQRQFGIQPITSLITTSWHGLNGASVKPSYGIGGSYIAHIGQNTATGLYVYRNSEEYNNASGGKRSFDLDIRFAHIWPSIILDTMGGISFVYSDTLYNAETKKKEKVVLLVNYLTLHGGVNMLIGNSRTTSLFIQTGIFNYKIDPQNGSSDGWHDYLYFLIEPRFSIQNAKIHVALFGLPFTSQEDMLYLSPLIEAYQASSESLASLGANFCMFNDHLYVKTTNITAGVHVTYTMPGINAMDLLDSSKLSTGISNSQFSITPFATIPLLGGTFTTSMSLSCIDLVNKDAETRKGAVRIRAGFSSQF